MRPCNSTAVVGGLVLGGLAIWWATARMTDGIDARNGLPRAASALPYEPLTSVAGVARGPSFRRRPRPTTVRDMAQLTRMSPSDYTWLQMDRPTNLMHVRCLLWYKGDLDLDDIKRVHMERMVDTYQVFKQRAILLDGNWHWQSVNDFDIARHIYEVELPGAGDRQAMLDYVAGTMPDQFDFAHSPWKLEVFRGVTGLADEPVTVVYQRFHHSMMDGIRMVQLLVHLHDFDAAHEAILPGSVGRTAKESGTLAKGLHTLRRGADEAADIARHVARGTAQLPSSVAKRLQDVDLARDDLSTLEHPSRLINAVQRFGSIDNKLLNTAGELARLVAAPHENRRAAWSSPPVVAKRVCFVDDMDLAAIRTFGQRHNATFNDVILAIVSKALTRYLQERRTPLKEVHWMLPVSLSPMDPDLPKVLGNNFALVFLPMPLGIKNWDKLLAAVKERSGRLKNSEEPAVAYELQRAMARAPKRLSVGLTNYFASKTVGVFTNVPGPTHPMYFAGAEAVGWIGFVPTSGDEPMGLAVFSYNGKVFLGVTTDGQAIPDPERISELIKLYYDELVESL